MADLTNEPLSGLLSMQTALNSKILELEISEKDEDAKIKKLTKKLDPIKTELKRREDIESSRNESKPDTNASNRFEDTQLLKEMKSQVDNIPVVGPGSELSLFLASLNNCYVAFVKNNTKFEKNFLLMAMGRLAQAFLTRVNNQTPAIETYDAFKKYLEDHHGSKKTIFQALDEIYDIEPKDNDMRDYAIKLENAGNDLFIKMEDKFNKSSKTLNARAVVDLVIAQHYVRNLRAQSDTMCYNSIVSSLSDCWDVSSVATHANSYNERAAKTDELATPNVFNVNRGKQKQTNNDGKNPKKETPKKKGICFRWRDKGVCNWKGCPFLHPGRVNQTQPKSIQPEIVDAPNLLGNSVINHLQPVPGFLNGSLPGANQ